MEELKYRTWQDFVKDQFRRSATVQLSIDELARDLYYDETWEEDEVEELDFGS